jgi:hypothetical protein
MAPLQRIVATTITDPVKIAALEKACRRARARRPAEKMPLPFKMAPLQRVVATTITDPAKIAALEEARKRAKAKRRAKKAKPPRSRAAAKKKA